MAFVILSAGTLAQSRMRTISARTFVGVLLAIVLATLVGGFALGYGLKAPAPMPVPSSVLGTVSVDPKHPEGQLLIDRFGEIAGRLVQLEVQAENLAVRLGAIKEFEARINDELLDAAKTGREAKTPVGTLGKPAGGPLLSPLPEADGRARPHALPPAPGAPRVDQDDPLSAGLSRIEHDLERVGLALAGIDAGAVDYRLAQMSFPGRTPVSGVEISSAFGNRADPFRKGLAFHGGIDYPAPAGTPIKASAGGRVVFAGWRSQYGKTVEITHGGGLATRYAHASKLHVAAGQVVMPGERIADVGSTGRSTGPHLHFEIVKDGEFVDPAFYLARF